MHEVQVGPGECSQVVLLKPQCTELRPDGMQLGWGR